MQKKYISANKYKKATVGDRKKRSENISQKLREAKNVGSVNETLKHEIKKTKKYTNKKRNKNVSKLTYICIICIVILLLCALRLVLKEDSEPFFDIFGVRIEEATIEKLDIAVVGNVDVLDSNSKNVVIAELNNYTNGVLLKVTDRYEIEYELLQSVEKVSNREYILKISDKNTLTSSVLKSRLNLYASESSKYYGNCKNIQTIEEIDSKNVKVILKEEDPLYIYTLQLPIAFSTANTGLYNINTTRGASNKITYIKKESVIENVPKSMSLTTVKTDNDAIELLKANTIDIFFTDSYDISEKLGKTEADIRSYLNGKCLFLLGNSSSDIFSKKEVRQAIAYSIDREKIRKEVYLNSGTIIDIPEIYSETKYKYDIYGAQNILLASGYVMNGAKFVKDGKTLSLTLLVNKLDETKVKVATCIKEDLEKIGIEVNLKLLADNELEKQIERKNYDLVLADVSLNENPDISFLEEYINLSDKIDGKIKEIKSSRDIQVTVEKVSELMQVMSDEVVCVGIHADTTYVVSKKGLDKFSNIKYMNVFSSLLLTNDK